MSDRLFLRARVAADAGGGGPNVLEAVAVRKHNRTTTRPQTVLLFDLVFFFGSS